MADEQRRRPGRQRLGLVAVLAVAAFGLGYLAGVQGSRTPTLASEAVDGATMPAGPPGSTTTGLTTVTEPAATEPAATEPVSPGPEEPAPIGPDGDLRAYTVAGGTVSILFRPDGAILVQDSQPNPGYQLDQTFADGVLTVTLHDGTHTSVITAFCDQLARPQATLDDR
ncbi:MAG: hypothetical protein ACK5PP_13940 [Acidimicrobiales bacterium]